MAGRALPPTRQARLSRKPPTEIEIQGSSVWKLAYEQINFAELLLVDKPNQRRL